MSQLVTTLKLREASGDASYALRVYSVGLASNSIVSSQVVGLK